MPQGLEAESIGADYTDLPPKLLAIKRKAGKPNNLNAKGRNGNAFLLEKALSLKREYETEIIRQERGCEHVTYIRIIGMRHTHRLFDMQFA